MAILSCAIFDNLKRVGNNFVRFMSCSLATLTDPMLHQLITFVHSVLFPRSYNREVIDTLTYRDLHKLLRLSHDGSQQSTALLHYRHPIVRILMWELKYHKSERAATFLAYALSLRLRERAHNTQKPTLVPIPISKKRLRERGYNQVHLILEKLPLFMEAVVVEDSLLMRTRHTKSQTKLTRAERLDNIFEAFAVTDNKLPKDTPIILVDDTLTTGATLRAGSAALQNAGFHNTKAVALAH